MSTYVESYGIDIKYSEIVVNDISKDILNLCLKNLSEDAKKHFVNDFNYFSKFCEELLKKIKNKAIDYFGDTYQNDKGIPQM